MLIDDPDIDQVMVIMDAILIVLADTFLAPSATREMVLVDTDRALDTTPSSSTMQADQGGST